MEKSKCPYGKIVEIVKSNKKKSDFLRQAWVSMRFQIRLGNF